MPSSSFTLTILVALVATPLIASFSPIKPFSLVILPRAGIRPTHAPTSDPSAAVADVSSPSALDAKRNEPEEEEGSGPFGFVSDFFSALDDFVDDATSRRLGNGAKFYGKVSIEKYFSGGRAGRSLSRPFISPCPIECQRSSRIQS